MPFFTSFESLLHALQYSNTHYTTVQYNITTKSIIFSLKKRDVDIQDELTGLQVDQIQISITKMQSNVFQICLLFTRVGHRILLRSELIVLLHSFKERNVLLHSFFEFFATYETQKNVAFFCVLLKRM